MATLRVRYRDGETDEWSLSEQMDLQELAKTFHFAMGQGNCVSLGVETRTGHEGVDYGFMGLRMDDVVMWEIDGLLDEARAASVWGLEQPPT